MKIKLTLALILALSCQSAYAQCTPSTCIDTAMINIANGNSITWDPINTNYPLIDPAQACNTVAPTVTGVEVYSLYAPSGVRDGGWSLYDDAFCLSPGCTYDVSLSISGGASAGTTAVVTASSPQCIN